MKTYVCLGDSNVEVPCSLWQLNQAQALLWESRKGHLLQGKCFKASVSPAQEALWGSGLPCEGSNTRAYREPGGRGSWGPWPESQVPPRTLGSETLGRVSGSQCTKPSRWFWCSFRLDTCHPRVWGRWPNSDSFQGLKEHTNTKIPPLIPNLSKPLPFSSPQLPRETCSVILSSLFSRLPIRFISVTVL